MPQLTLYGMQEKGATVRFNKIKLQNTKCKEKIKGLKKTIITAIKSNMPPNIYRDYCVYCIVLSSTILNIM